MSDQWPTRGNEPSTPRPPDAPGAWPEPNTYAPGETMFTQPVERSRPPSRRGRWIVAGGATALVAAGAAAIVILASRTPPSDAVAYMPPDTVFYTEARLDLPGTQRASLIEFVGHFPGFEDGATIDTKVDESLDNLLGDGTNGEVLYTRDFKPWFGGQVAVGLLEIPDVASLPMTDPSAVPQQPRAPRTLIVAGVKDRAAAQTQLDRVLEVARGGGAVVASSDHRGTLVYRLSPQDTTQTAPPIEVALTDTVMLIGVGEGEVATALDRKLDTGPNLGSSQGFADAVARLPADRLGSFYLDGTAYRAQLQTMLEQASLGSGLRDVLLSSYPDHVTGSLHVQNDRLVMEAVSQPPEGAVRQPVRDSGLGELVPSDALVLYELRDVGANAGRLIAALKTEPTFQQNAQDLEDIEALIGAPLQEYLDWLGDAAVFAGVRDGLPHGGLVATVTNEETAGARLRQLVALIRQGAGSAGGGLEIRTEEYAGTEVTTIELGALIGGFGAPPDPDAAEQAQISFAIRDGFLRLGVGKDAARQLLDLDPANSLARAVRFSEALTAAGGPATSGVVYLDMAGIRDAIVAQLPPDDRTRYDAEFAPYLEPLDVLIMAGNADGEVDRGRVHITLSGE